MTDEPGDEESASLLRKFSADPPQRYFQNYARYAARGGVVRPGDFLRTSLAADVTNASDVSRLYFFWLVFDFIVKERLEGDIAELGVYRGGTATLLATFARELRRTAYLLDTFEGFRKTDLAGIDEGTPVGFADTSLEAVRATVGEDCVRFVKGHFPGSAAAIPTSTSFCLVHLDCDLYAPMRDALEYFYPRLVPGGFLIVHDYSSLHWNGPERAVDEFLIGKTESAIPVPDNAGSIAIRKSRPADLHVNWLVRKRFDLLKRGEWVSAGNAALSELLCVGWSVAEKWGIWGVGRLHELPLHIFEARAVDVELSADVHAVLLGERTSQDVEVEIAGQTLAIWRFTLEHNRAVRSVIIPAALVARAISASDTIPVVVVQFKPRCVASPAELDPRLSDHRTLGLGLNALCVRTSSPA